VQSIPAATSSFSLLWLFSDEIYLPRGVRFMQNGIKTPLKSGEK